MNESPANSPFLEGDVVTLLRDAYACLAELWAPPRDADGPALLRRSEETAARLHAVDPEAAALLSRYLESPVTEDEYVELFELDPKCPLYLGSHLFDEPKTCAGAAISDRNGYMIELQAMYRHFGLDPNGKELADYLPLLVEFLALTAGSEDPIRVKLIREYVLPPLAPVRAKLESLQSRSLCLLQAFEKVLALDLKTARSGAAAAERSGG